jgi:dimethylhistidine N-methyltransferase
MRPANARIHVRESAPGAAVAAFAADVRHYLAQEPRQLPSRYLYDPLGSSLFDAICRLPWYPLTEGEMRLLAREGAAILKQVAPLARIVELGSGSGEKLAALLAGTAGRRRALDLHLIDISRAALDQAARTLTSFDRVRVIAHQADYEAGLRQFAGERRGPGHTLAVFLGSNIGNYDPPAAAALLRAVREALGPGDAFLIGVDLVKPEAALMAAYDDPLGVTAAFNRNLLVRINRELDGDFDLGAFRHQAVWNADASRVEMHLVSTRAQRVRVRQAGLDVKFKKGESIWTESSYKYEPEAVTAQLEAAGFHCRSRWIDQPSQFSLTLAETVSG